MIHGYPDGVLRWAAHSNTAMPPVKHYTRDAGFDLTCSGFALIEAQQHGLIPTDVAAFAEGYWFMIVGRSSARMRGLVVHPGIIDEGYTGELFIAVFNTNDYDLNVEPGERIGQMIPFPTIHLELQQVDRLPESERGSNGFGSTGS